MTTPRPADTSPDMTALYVALGGAIGALLRYATTLAVAAPLGTLIVNVLGSFAMGLAFVFVTAKGLDRAALFLMTGVLGGFTTFSAFSLDAYRLYAKGELASAATYVAGSVVLSVAGLVAGILLARAIST